jgi:hypothetical protein
VPFTEFSLYTNKMESTNSLLMLVRYFWPTRPAKLKFPSLFALVVDTYSVEQSPSWEVARFTVSQEIPRLLWNPKVQHRIHKCPPPVSILNQTNPVHAPIQLLEDHFNISLPSMLRSSRWSLSLRSPTQNPGRYTKDMSQIRGRYWNYLWLSKGWNKS